jgi:Family of unknown function (DUF5719)
VKQTTVSLIGAAAALAVIAGIASATASDGDSAPTTAAAARMPVQRTTLTCPQPSTSELAETTYSAFSPGNGNGTGKAALVPAMESGRSGSTKPVAPLTAAGKPVDKTTSDDAAPALAGSADGAFAPGYSVQQTTRISAGEGRGILGLSCGAPGAEFWFPGASTAKSRDDYIHLTNPDDAPAVVDIELYGKDGQIAAPEGDSLNVPGHGTLPVRMSTLTSHQEQDITVHVVARSGRVGAQVQAVDQATGGDWLPASTGPAASLVIPGLPKDTTSARLVVFAPGSEDADLKVRLATPSGAITPAGHETVHVKDRMTTAIDLGDITQGEAGSLLLTPSDPKQPVPVAAALQVVRGKGEDREMAYIPATEQIADQATVSGNLTKGSTLFLTAPGKAAGVRITASASSGGGQPASTTVQVKADSTLSVTPPKPTGKGVKGTYTITVEPVSGGPVYASRMLAETTDGVPTFTIQPMPDDHAKVAVPTSKQNVAILNH